MSTPARSARGTIYDIGYQRYDGARLGRRYAVRSLFTHGLRTVFAFGRDARARAIPMILGAFAIIPAVVQATIAAYTGNLIELVNYSNYFFNLSLVFALFCAAQAPELVSADLRNRSLVLYLARALRREDYVLAKVFALASGVFLLTVLPLMILFAGRVFAAAETWPALQAEASELLPILGSSLVIGLVMAAISVAISSLTARRALASAAVLGIFIVLSAVGGILMEAISASWESWLTLLNPFLVLGGFAQWIFQATPSQNGPLAFLELPGWAFGAACAGYILVASSILMLRYRRVDA